MSGPKLPYLVILSKKYILRHILMKLGHLIVIEGSLVAYGTGLSYEINIFQKITFGEIWAQITIFGHFAQKSHFGPYLDETWLFDSN